MPRPWCWSSTRKATSASVRPDDVEAADGDHLAAEQHHQRDPVAVVDVGEPADVALRELGIGEKNR